MAVAKQCGNFCFEHGPSNWSSVQPVRADLSYFFLYLYTEFFYMHNATPTNFKCTHSTEQNNLSYLYKYIIILHGDGIVVNLPQELCCHHFIRAILDETRHIQVS